MEFDTKQWLTVQATRLSLSGLSQDEISRQLKVSEGTVNSIIQHVSNSNDTFLLQHEIAILCRKDGISIKQLASNLQYANAIKKMGFEKNKTDLLLQAINSIFSKDASLSHESVANLVYQICDMILKYNFAPDKIAEVLQSKYCELDDIEQKLNENKNLLAQSENEKKETLEKNNSTLEQLEQFTYTKNQLKKMRIDISNLRSIANIIANIRELSRRPTRIIYHMKKYSSIKNEKTRLERECEILEANLEFYRKKEEEEKKYWASLYTSKNDFDKLLVMGISPDLICKIHEIVSRHWPSLSLDELLSDISTYGGIKGAIFKNHRILTKLNMNLQMNCQSISDSSNV